MDLTFLANFAVPIIVGVCLCVGYVIKNVITTDTINKYIPLIMAVLGVVRSIQTAYQKIRRRVYEWML